MKIKYTKMSNKNQHSHIPRVAYKETNDENMLLYYQTDDKKDRPFYPLEVDINVELSSHFRAGTILYEDGIEMISIGGYIIPKIVSELNDFIFFNKYKKIATVVTSNTDLLDFLSDYPLATQFRIPPCEISGYKILKKLKLDNLAYMFDIHDKTYIINSMESYIHISRIIQTGLECDLTL